MSENELRWQLRQLPRGIDPPRDLWPGIAARLADRPARRRRPGWPVGLALAASLVLAVVAGTSLRPPAAPPADPAAALVQREAEALTREYEAALVELRGAPVPEPVKPALVALDASADEIRAALAADPGRTYLIDQLRRTYARRLSLTQSAVLG